MSSHKFDNEQERNAAIARANKAYAENRKSSLKGRALNDLEARIRAKLVEAERLENSRVGSAREATENMRKAEQLRHDAQEMQRYTVNREAWISGRAEEIALEDNQKVRAVQAQFSDMQASFLTAEDDFNTQVQDIMDNLAFNPAVGVDKRTIVRNVQRILRNEGESDAKGNTFVRFSEGAGRAVYRVVRTKGGAWGVILESRGDSTWGDGE